MGLFSSKKKPDQSKSPRELVDALVDMVKLLQAKISGVEAEIDAIKTRFKKKVPVSEEGEPPVDKTNINDGFDSIRNLKRELSPDG